MRKIKRANILFEKFEGRRPKCRWEDNTEIYSKEIGLYDMHQI
jgi:hypothetical protein